MFFCYHVFGYSSCMQTTEDLRKIQTINSCMISVGRCLSLWWNYQMYSHKTLFSLRRRLICHCITQLGYLIHFSLKGKFQEQFRVHCQQMDLKRHIFIIEMVFPTTLFILYPILRESSAVLFSQCVIDKTTVS